MITRTVAVTIPPQHARADGIHGSRPGTGRHGQGQNAETEGQGRHDDRAETQSRPFHGGFDHFHPISQAGLGELDDQDGVFRGQT